MLIEERELRVAELRPGMYVSRLDRDWVGTPYLLQGFLVESQDDIAQLAQYCKTVVVDVGKSDSFVRGALTQPVASVTTGYEVPKLSAIGANPRPVLTRIEDEVPRASAALDNAHRAAHEIVLELRNGGRLDEQAVGEAVTPVVDSIVRNPDAFFWLETLRQHDSYTYSHAVNCCGFMATFGRHLGFPDEALRDLATAGLLLDIGKTAIPEPLLESNTALDEDQLGLVRSHLTHSVRLYDESGAANGQVRDMILTHHEREDGSGYPARLTGDEIPLFGRIAGIVDSYDAMTSARPYREPLSRYEALQVLYKQRGTLYQADLVEQFVQCLGAYPVGTLVELSTGEVAIVLAQNPVRRLFPRVMLLTDADKQLRATFEPLDLRDTWGAYDTRQVSIRRGLKPGTYGLDPKELYL
jgi:HD-GYP domain-containing protein (c-di-GMP phosphodiesterase class II)